MNLSYFSHSSKRLLKNWSLIKLFSILILLGTLGMGSLSCSVQKTTPPENETSSPTPLENETSSSPPPENQTSSPTPPENQTPSPTTSENQTPSTAQSKYNIPISPNNPTPSKTDVSQGSGELPEPNEQGDYMEKSYHTSWQVVDSDPNGLNCRMGNLPINEVWNPSTGKLEINSWPVVGNFKQNQYFEAELSPGGFVITFDANDHPWIYVKNSPDQGTPNNCFVRANNKFVKPVPTMN